MTGIDALWLFVLLGIAETAIGVTALVYELDAFCLDELVSRVCDVFVDDFQDALTVHLVIKFVVDLLHNEETVL